jgi:hypothetical protein
MTRSDKTDKPTFTHNPYANAMSRCFAEPLHAGNVVEKVGIDVSDKDSDNIAVWLVENAKVKEALAVYGFCLVHDRGLDRDRCANLALARGGGFRPLGGGAVPGGARRRQGCGKR